MLYLNQRIKILGMENNVNTPTLETERLILKRFTERDMEALFLILKDEEANKFLPWYTLKKLEETHDFDYGLRKGFWHKGIVTEAAMLCKR
jgi:ribosomal-protein-alanine N-acetyltransferase